MAELLMEELDINPLKVLAEGLDNTELLEFKNKSDEWLKVVFSGDKSVPFYFGERCDLIRLHFNLAKLIDSLMFIREDIELRDLLWSEMPLAVTDRVIAAIYRFYIDFDIETIRFLLWDSLDLALQQKGTIYDHGLERSNLLFHYRQLLHIVEGCSKLYQNNMKFKY